MTSHHLAVERRLALLQLLPFHFHATTNCSSFLPPSLPADVVPRSSTIRVLQLGAKFPWRTCHERKLTVCSPTLLPQATFRVHVTSLQHAMTYGATGLSVSTWRLMAFGYKRAIMKWEERRKKKSGKEGSSLERKQKSKRKKREWRRRLEKGRKDWFCTNPRASFVCSFLFIFHVAHLGLPRMSLLCDYGFGHFSLMKKIFW